MNNELQKRILSSLILLPITLFFIFQGSIFFLFFLSIFFLVSSYEWIKINKKNITRIIGIIYIFSSFYFAYVIRDKFSTEVFILILIICIFTDLGGYIFGKIFKGPKLTKISPKKTYAGAIGGIILSLISALIYTKSTTIGAMAYLNFIIPTSNNSFLNNFFLIFVLFISLTSQIGDLIISYFKRKANVKDTGNIIPGHGGMLDRLDGIIFAIPISYILIILLK